MSAPARGWGRAERAVGIGACRRKAGHDDLGLEGGKAMRPGARMNGHLNSIDHSPRPRLPHPSCGRLSLVSAVVVPCLMPYRTNARSTHSAIMASILETGRAGAALAFLVGTNSKSQSFLHALLLRAAIIAWRSQFWSLASPKLASTILLAS